MVETAVVIGFIQRDSVDEGAKINDGGGVDAGAKVRVGSDADEGTESVVGGGVDESMWSIGAMVVNW